MNNQPDIQSEDDPLLDASENLQDEMNPEDFVEIDEATANCENADPFERLTAELAESEKKALRYQADLDNFRRRARREGEEMARYAALPLVTELLDALDNLNRAIDASAGSADSSALEEGVRMVATQLSQTLAHHDCKAIEAVGQPFDPNLHQAVQMVPSDEIPANHVVQELRTGFRFHDRVLRPAQVFVSTGPGQ